MVLASDHGHVWHRDQAADPRPPSAAARWRPADGPARDGEVLLEGPRVRGPGGRHRLIAPWAEDVRYGAARNGYHGGATPQEMVAPLVAAGRRDRPPARAGAVRAAPARLVGRAGRPPARRDRGDGRPPPPPGPDPRRLPVPAGAGPAEAEARPAPARRPPSRPRRRPARLAGAT